MHQVVDHLVGLLRLAEVALALLVAGVQLDCLEAWVVHQLEGQCGHQAVVGALVHLVEHLEDREGVQEVEAPLCLLVEVEAHDHLVEVEGHDHLVAQVAEASPCPSYSATKCSVWFV